MNKKGAICFFNSTKTWGGGEKWHYEMASYLHDKGYKVLVIVSPGSELSKKLFKNRIQTIAVKVSNFSYLNRKKVNYLAGSLKKHAVDTIVMNSSEDMKLGGLAASKIGVSRIIYRRGSAIPIKDTFINRYFFKNIISEVLANSMATKETINKNNEFLFPEAKIKIIPNGIDVTTFDSLSYVKLYEKSKDDLILGNLGRMVFQKNQEFLIDVALELRKRILKFKILIGGTGKLENELKEKVKRHQLEENILFLGFIENPKSFMMSLDVFLLPSRWEGFGYVVAEAMLSSKPTIAFDISSNGQLIDSGENGFLTPFNNVKLFCDKIEWFSKKPSKIIEMGEKGRNKVVCKFNSELIQNEVKKYLLE